MRPSINHNMNPKSTLNYRVYSTPIQEMSYKTTKNILEFLIFYMNLCIQPERAASKARILAYPPFTPLSHHGGQTTAARESVHPRTPCSALARSGQRVRPVARKTREGTTFSVVGENFFWAEQCEGLWVVWSAEAFQEQHLKQQPMCSRILHAQHRVVTVAGARLREKVAVRERLTPRGAERTWGTPVEKRSKGATCSVVVVGLTQRKKEGRTYSYVYTSAFSMRTCSSRTRVCRSAMYITVSSRWPGSGGARKYPLSTSSRRAGRSEKGVRPVAQKTTKGTTCSVVVVTFFVAEEG